MGRCFLCPIFRRSYSDLRKLGTPLRAALVWWLLFLRDYCPRPIHCSIQSLPCVASYSEGGSYAGIGAAVWHGKEVPLVVFSTVPTVIRNQWQRFSGTDGHGDIFLIEALGPLVLLLVFPKIFRDAMWIYYIDNTAAEASLIRGATSSYIGNHIVGLTWLLIQKRRLWPYFELSQRQIQLMVCPDVSSWVPGKEFTSDHSPWVTS